MENYSKPVSGGIGVLDVILIVNIILKVLKIITWSWVLVLWPLWVGLGLLGLIIIVFFIVYFINR